MKRARRPRGFTLIEVLVSVFLLAVLAAFAYETLNYARRARESTKTAFGRVRALELAVHTLVTDFEQLEPRPVRDLIGATSLPAILADARSTDLVTLTRGGWSNPAGLPRGTLQRVSYRLDNGTLKRSYLTVLDATLANAPISRELLGNVKTLTLRYLDASRQWQTQWPPLVGSNPASGPLLRTRPLAVEITIELNDFGKIVRLVEVPG
jgi:general secretion pathway protein J